MEPDLLSWLSGLLAGTFYGALLFTTAIWCFLFRENTGLWFREAVLGFIILTSTFETYLDLRQFNKIASKFLPKALEGVVTEEKFKSAREYNLDKCRYGLVHSAWSTLEHVAVLAFGFMPWLWDLSAAVLVRFGFDVASNEILQTIIFLAVYNTIGQVMGLPWSIFHTFVLEEKHGFNKQTPWLFFMDMVKSNLLTAIIGPPVIAAIIAIVQRTGPLFPLYLWLFLFIFALVMMTVYPTLIQPLFNKFSPLPEGKLREDIEALAARLKFPLKKLFVIDGSKRSSHSNAYMFGFFKNKRIVLFDTLVNQSTPEQVVAVIAHELGHWKLNHTLFNFVTMQVLLLVQLGGYSLFRTYSDVFTSFGFSLGNGVQHPVLIGLLLYNYMLSPVDHLIHFGQNLLSRRFEFQADAFAKDLGYCESLCSGLVKLQEENLSSMDSDPLYSAYHYSHPPLIERLSALCGPGQSIADLATKKDQ